MIAAYTRSPHPDQKFFKYALGAGVVKVIVWDIPPCAAPDEMALAGVINDRLARLWSEGCVYLLVIRWEGRMLVFEGGSGRPEAGNI